jgi:hypothetical protein
MHSHYDTLITTIFTTGCIFTGIYLLAIPATVIGLKLWHKKTGKKIPCPNFGKYATRGATLTLIAGTIALFITYFTTSDGVFFALACTSTIGIGLILFRWVDRTDTRLSAYFKIVTGGIGIFLTLTTLTCIPAAADRIDYALKTENDAYNQTTTIHLDPNNQKLEGETRTYPVTSLRTNRQGTSYSWIEHTKNGTLTTRTVGTPDERYEVTIKDDLPATDTEPRVERTVEYQIKGEEVATGKEPCIEKNSKGDIGTLPTCNPNNPNQTEARFIKTRTVIHIPAGSADKTITVTSE